jgi:hypothetical protein
VALEVYNRAAAFSEARLLCVDGACGSSQRILGFQGLIENNTPNRTLTELRIASAYVKLSRIPEDSSEASVSLASIRTCEIRMFRGPEADCDRMPLFWLELFDHSAKTSIDSFSCHEIKEAVAIFDDFISQAGRLNEPGPGIAETQS